MSKYEALWQFVACREGDLVRLSFDDVYRLTGVPLDHSFLTYKKELLSYGWQVSRISMKQKTILLKRIER